MCARKGCSHGLALEANFLFCFCGVDSPAIAYVRWAKHLELKDYS